VEQADSLLRGLLPGPLAAALAGAELQPIPASTTGPGLRLGHGDILYMVAIPLQQAPSFLVLEHKSYRDAKLLRQMLRYGVHLSEAWMQEHGTLPSVLPVVVHHGRRPMAPPQWRPPAARRRVNPAFAGFDPELRLCIIDLTVISEAELRRRVTSPLACLTLLLLQFLPRRDNRKVAAALLRWADLFRSVEAAPGGQVAMEQLSSYVLCVAELSEVALAALTARILQKPTESYVMSTANRLRAEGKAEGKAEGEVKARAKALAEAQSRLLRQLEIRFGSIPADLEARVRRGTSDDLDLWSVRLLQASSIAEVFAGE
jgi:hypothetical protein